MGKFKYTFSNITHDLKIGDIGFVCRYLQDLMENNVRLVICNGGTLIVNKETFDVIDERGVIDEEDSEYIEYEVIKNELINLNNTFVWWIKIEQLLYLDIFNSEAKDILFEKYISELMD